MCKVKVKYEISASYRFGIHNTSYIKTTVLPILNSGVALLGRHRLKEILISQFYIPLCIIILANAPLTSKTYLYVSHPIVHLYINNNDNTRHNLYL